MDQHATQVDAAPAPVSTPDPTAPAPRRTPGSRVINIALGIAVALAVGGVGFAAGRFTAPAAAFANGNRSGQVFNGTGGTGGTGGQGRQGFFSGGGPTIEGTVESVTATTMTVKTASGQTIQIAIDGTTTYHAQTDATSSDVVTGGKVLVRLDVGSFGGGANGGGPAASGSPGSGSGPTASDVTVVP